jgi:tRNA G26 N,N-dimethylase Trm1
MSYCKKIENKKMFEKAKADAEVIYKIELDIKDDNFQFAVHQIHYQTGFKNLLAHSIVGGLKAVGWRATNIDGFKTLFVRKDLI